MSSWLDTAAADRSAFLSALRAYADEGAAGSASNHQGGASLYQAFVGAHVTSGRPALAIETRGERKTLPYDELHTLTGRLERAWARAGLEPGALVALVVPMSVEFVVALLTCMRMGLVAAPLASRGRAWVDKRLEVLQPDAIFAGRDGGAFGAQWPAPLLPWLRDEDAPAPESGSCDPGAPVLRVFSPYAPEPLTAFDVPAQALLDASLCDGLITLGLDRRDVVAAPGWDESTCQPFFILATLMAGACWAELGEASVRARPRILAEAGVTLLGVRSSLRDVLLAGGEWKDIPLRAWFRDLLEPQVGSWDELVRQTAARGVTSFCLGMAPTAGGAMVFSPPSLAMQPALCWPVPVRDHQLAELGSVDLPALADVGLLTPLADGKPVGGAPALVFGRRGAGYQYAGCAQIGRGGQVYPEDEVVALAKRHPDVTHATVVVTPSRPVNDAHVTLLLFCSPDRAEAGSVRTHEVRNLIAQDLGTPWLPDRVEWIALRPRLTADGIDRDWCRAQYLSGALLAKAANPMFRLLSQLGEMAELHLEGSA